MKYKLIFQVALCIGISAPMLISSSTVKAQNTRFRGASYQSGYFHRDGTIYYRDVNDDNSRSYCGFASSGHLATYRSVVAGDVNYRNPPSDTGSYTGACGLPAAGYLSHGRTTYFAENGGSFCGFSNPQSYNSHRQANPNARNYGRLDVAPQQIMNYTGACGQG